MATTQKFVADVTINSRPAINNLDLLEKAVKRLDKEAKRLKKNGDLLGAQQAKDKQEELNKTIAMTKHQVKDVGSAFTTAGKSVAGLENALKQATDKWRRLTNEADRDKMAVKIRAIKTEIDRLNNSLGTTGTMAHDAFGKLAQRAAEYMSMYALYNRTSQIIKTAIAGNLQLSDSISDIQKVSGLSEEAVKGLVSQIEKLDSRNAPEVLNNMAYAAGKLGIKGSENLLGFTRAADKLNVALKEYLGDGAEGVVQLMKFANVMGTTDQYGVEQALLKTGSALNYMTQSTAAAADYMIDFAGRFGPIARQARMTSGDVIGLASALDALTVNNEEAATSLQKFVVKLLSSPTAVSKALGMDAQLSKQMVETGKSIELVEMALGKLGERAEKYGVSGIASVIGDIGSRGQAQRLIKTLATLSNNTEMVANYVTMANDAFRKGTSVIDEYNIKNQNAAAIMERAKNIWQKMLVNSEEVGLVKELAEEFYNMSVAMQNDSAWMNNLYAAMKLVLNTCGALIKVLPQMLTFLTFTVVSRGVLALLNLAQAMWQARTAFVAMNATMKASVMGAFATVVIMLANAFSYYGDELVETVKREKEAEKETNKFKEAFNGAQAEVVAATRELDKLFGALQATNNTEAERIRLINLINSKYGSYLSHMLTEKSNASEIAAAYDEINKKLRENIMYKAKLGMIESVEQSRGEDLVNNMQEFKARLEERLKVANKLQAGQKVDDKGIQTIVQSVANILSQKLMESGNAGKDIYGLRDELENIVYAEGLKRFGWQALQGAGFDNTIGMDEEMRRLLGNLSVVAIHRDEELKTAEDMYAPFLKDFVPAGADGTTSVLEDFSKEEQERKRQEQDELENAKKDISSIKSQLTAFYEWRESEIQKMRDQNEITEATKDLLVDANKAAHATSEMKAWEYLLGKDGAKVAWQDQLAIMRGEILKANPQMQALWDYLTKVNMEGLGSTLRRLGTQEIGGMEKTIATDADVVAKHAAKLAQAIQKELEKYDYIATVRTKFVNGLTQLGLLKTKFSEGEYGGNSWENEIAAANDAVDQIQSHYDELFDIDIDTNEGVEKFRDILYQCTALSTEIVEGSVDSIRLLYEKAMEMGEEYTVALKRQTDKQKRIIQERWKRDPVNIEMQSAIKEQESLNKMTGGVMGRMGLQSNVATQDAEIQLYALRLQAATDYYNKLKAEKADQRLLDEQEQKMMEATVALTDKMASKITNMQQWFVDAMNTLPDYGTALGEAFAKSDPEERAEAFQEAHKEILKSLAETTKKMIIEWTKQRIQHAVNQQLMAQDTKKSGQEQFQAETTAQSAISNAMAAIGQQTLQTQQAQSQQSLATEASETQGKVALGIAGGAAKTIGELGWWGVPLVAVITALLNGLLSWALGSLFKGKSSSTANTPKMKLVSGMLTYDSGNVADVVAYGPHGANEPNGKYLGTDGRTYSATPTPTPDGVAMVNHPIATMIGGMPALVGERGQEMIIGRRTLRDMTMFRPDLIQQIAAFERRRFRTYDEGNVGAMTGMTELRNNGMTGNQEQMLQTMEQMQVVLATLSKRLEHPIQATINKYGSGGLVDEVADGLYATKKRGNNTNVRRLFG